MTAKRSPKAASPSPVPAFTPIRTEPVTIPALDWSPTLCDGKNVTWAQAEAACVALGEGWRLPTVQELFSLLDVSRKKPAIDVERFPDTKSDWYWTATPHAWSPADFAWFVCFNDGYAASYLRSDNSACVRAVRSVVPGQCL